MCNTRDKRLTSANKEKIACNMYQNNASICDIAKKIMTSRETVVRILKRHNIYDAERSKKRVTLSYLHRVERTLLMYSKGKSVHDIAIKLNVTEYTIRRILLLNMVNKELTRHDCRAMHLFNEKFFSKIETEEQAYWLGFLYADGCNTGRGVHLSLALKDRVHIEKFKKALQYDTAKLLFRENPDSITLCIGSRIMANDLNKLGCTERKTHNLCFPSNDQVPLYLIHHFMRGYFDGDGCICVRPRQNKTMVGIQSSVNIVGTKDFLMQYQQILDNSMQKSHHTKITEYKNIHRICYNGASQTLNIYNFLYNNATIFLDRKKEKFQLLCRLKSKSQ